MNEYDDPPSKNIFDQKQVFGGCFVYLSLYAVNQAQVMNGGHKINFEANLQIFMDC